MQVSLAAVPLYRCAKPGCTNTNLVRHHKRNEHRWIKHFQHRSLKPSASSLTRQRFEEFKQRYESFDSRDTVLICQDHHEEIHELYEQELRRACAAKEWKPLRKWTWREAVAFMNKCETLCKWWLKQETPGSQNRVLTRS